MAHEDRGPRYCRWRENILCSSHQKCGKCGWNPSVENTRKERINKDRYDAREKKSGLG